MTPTLLNIRTRDGTMPVERFGDTGNTGVIVYMDGFGVRDELRDICIRFAEMGHTTYLPNMYYREGGQSFPPPNAIDDKPPEGAQRLNRATSVAMSVEDTGALLASEPVAAWATVGYCMGGRHAIGAAAAYPDRVKACLSLHGGHMIGDGEWSCERQIPRIGGEIFLGFAKHDPSCPEHHKDALREALATPGVCGQAVDFDAMHGWSFPDRHCFDREASEAVWSVAERMFERRLQSMGALSSSALRADVIRYACMGEHRTASPVDVRTSAWIRDELRVAGLSAELDTWSLRQFQLDSCWVSAFGKRYDAFPLWHPTPIGHQPLEGSIVPGDGPVDGKIALVTFEDVMVTPKSCHAAIIDRLAKGGAKAVIGCTPHFSGEVFGQNVIPPYCQNPWQVPVVMVAPRHWHVLADAAAHGDAVKVMLSGTEDTSARAHNVVARLSGGDRWIIVSTPQSGWFRCAGERGAGVALLLGLARWASTSGLQQSFVFLSNSGHELGHMGIHHLFDRNILPPPEQTDCWLHLGSSIGVHGYTERDGVQIPDGAEKESWLFCSGDLENLLQSAFHSLPHLNPARYNRKNGEIRWILERGYTAFALMGPQRFFHLDTDGPEVVNPDLLSSIGHALKETFLTLGSGGQSGEVS